MNPEINQEEKWRKLLLEHKTTDMTIKSYCKINDVKVHQFTYWRNKIERGIVRKKKSKSTFIKVATVNKESINYDDLSIVINKIKINIPVNFDSFNLTKLIKVVRSID